MRALYSLFLLLLLCGWPAVSAADESLTVEMARRHYQNGAAYYEQANFKEAKEEFEKAYKLEAKPELLYNIGRCQEGLGELELAIASYEEYLGKRPQAGNRQILELRIANLKQRMAQERPPGPAKGDAGGETATTDGPSEGSRARSGASGASQGSPHSPTGQASVDSSWSSSTRSILGWSALGLGAAGLIAGGVLGGLARAKTAEYEDAYLSHGTYSEAQATLDRARGLETGCFVALGVGAAVMAAGAVLLVLEWRAGNRGKEGETLSARLMPRLNGGAMTLDF